MLDKISLIFDKISIDSILLFIFGILLLRKAEQIKSSVVKKADFSSKWANEFFEIYKAFLNHAEDILTYMFHLQSSASEEMENLRIKLTESIYSINRAELHISIMIETFPEIKEKSDSKNYANLIISQLTKLLDDKKGNIDEIKQTISKFSIAARKLHSKLLEQ